MNVYHVSRDGEIGVSLRICLFIFQEKYQLDTLTPSDQHIMPDQSYRKVDIDALDEDQYVEEEEQIASGSAAVDVKAIQSEVRALIQK